VGFRSDRIVRGAEDSRAGGFFGFFVTKRFGMLNDRNLLFGRPGSG